MLFHHHLPRYTCRFRHVRTPRIFVENRHDHKYHHHHTHHRFDERFSRTPRYVLQLRIISVHAHARYMLTLELFYAVVEHHYHLFLMCLKSSCHLLLDVDLGIWESLFTLNCHRFSPFPWKHSCPAFSPLTSVSYDKRHNRS